MIPVTAIFDIGKTNKKFFLFDSEFREVYKVYHRLEYTTDEDGDPCESIKELTAWIKETLATAMELPDFNIRKLNFTTYGASLVHLDREGFPVTPLYNYTKSYPIELLEKFYSKFGGKNQFCIETSSPALGMVNAGLQLFWLKYSKPEIFKKIHNTLHLPQYLSYLFTGKMVSDYTSIGCHTGMWDFAKDSYHDWLEKEDLIKLLPRAVSTSETYPISFRKQSMSVGVGVHDSSSALVPYLIKNDEPFALLSTGTWAISINPFNTLPLNLEELERDCLHFIGIHGQPIKISRLYIGEEHKYQIEKLYEHFKLEKGYYKALKFDSKYLKDSNENKTKKYHFQYLNPEVFGLSQAKSNDFSQFENFESAYYCFLDELTDLQVASLKLVLDQFPVKKLYIDGGFNANEIFVEMLRIKLPYISIETSNFALGTALGAALLVNKVEVKLLKVASSNQRY
ncbi:FGGY family carbohydrate kinase [Belliella sp. DSM 111904]|uniref:FGGY family carbohydrate kinase n=1 Tax=Belliella filtrata TaxID=2923435 RepID=A0ABS9UZ56_9BACT|nr:FGGY family carbohydrate kinase [Belliella filtrata]MCH7409363.1 FGGY family carbohydrate kinase [Belliella filtrata]